MLNGFYLGRTPPKQCYLDMETRVSADRFATILNSIFFFHEKMKLES